VKVVRSQPAPDPGFRRRLANEARALSRVNSPQVAGIYDFLADGDRDVIVMEYVPGATLKDLLEDGPLPLGQLTALAIQMLRGLAAAHGAGVVHSDIKPSNITVTAAGQLKILDFGLAKVVRPESASTVSTHVSSAGSLAGTMPYMSPEQLRGLPIDHRSDIFSAGAVLYEMATGSRAFPHRQPAQLIDALLHEEPVPASTIAGVPKCLDRVIARALAKDASRRYQGATQFAAAVAQAARSRETQTRGLSAWLSWMR
jgi:serine/threonine protein kinase